MDRESRLRAVEQTARRVEALHARVDDLILLAEWHARLAMRAAAEGGRLNVRARSMVDQMEAAANDCAEG